MIHKNHSVHKNVTNSLALLRVLVAQSIERPPSVQKVVGSNPIMGSEFFSEYYWFEKRRQKLDFPRKKLVYPKFTDQNQLCNVGNKTMG